MVCQWTYFIFKHLEYIKEVVYEKYLLCWFYNETILKYKNLGLWCLINNVIVSKIITKRGDDKKKKMVSNTFNIDKFSVCSNY